MDSTLGKEICVSLNIYYQTLSHYRTLIQCPILEAECRKDGQQPYSIEDNEFVRTRFWRILKTLYQTLSGCWIRSNTLETQTLLCTPCSRGIRLHFKIRMYSIDSTAISSFLNSRFLPALIIA